MTAKELILAARELAKTLSAEQKAELVREAVATTQRRDEERTKRLRMTRDDLERTYSL